MASEKKKRTASSGGWAAALILLSLSGALWLVVSRVNATGIGEQSEPSDTVSANNQRRPDAATLDVQDPLPDVLVDGPKPSQESQDAGDGGEVVVPTPAAALDAASSMLSFQALLTDGGGSPLPGPTVDLEFNIYDGVGALVEGPVLLNDVPVTGGVVDAQVPVSPSSFDGSKRLLGVTVNPPADELSPRLSLTSVPYAFRVDRVASKELDNDIELGNAMSTGSLTVYRTTSNTPSILLSGLSSQISTYGSDGLEQIRLWGASWGEILLSDSTDNDVTARLTATGNSGGELILYDADGDISVFADGDSTRGSLLLYNANHDDTLQLSGDDGDGGARLSLRDGTLETVRLDGSGGGGGAGVTLSNSAGTNTIVLDADAGDDALVRIMDANGDIAIEMHSADTYSAGRISMYARDTGGNARETIEIIASEGTDGTGQSNNGGQIILRRADGSDGITLDAEHGAEGSSRLLISNSTGASTIGLDGDEGDDGALLTLSDGTQVTIDLDANGGGGGAGVTLSNGAGTNTIVFDADAGDDALVRIMDANGDIAIEMHSDDTYSAGRISMYARDTGGNARETIEIIASEGTDGTGQSDNGGQIRLSKASGEVSITLDAEHGVDGEARIIVGSGGRVVTPVIEITGGADLSENFDIAGRIRPGYVVCIDARNPGKLAVSREAYDRSVAGVVSGANGVRPGMLMGQRGSEADGALPVALTGRVYVWADAANGPISPGDLLTSSNTPGHAMKVTDHGKAQGATIGKAMSALATGRGLVLVLVSLQ